LPCTGVLQYSHMHSQLNVFIVSQVVRRYDFFFSTGWYISDVLSSLFTSCFLRSCNLLSMQDIWQHASINVIITKHNNFVFFIKKPLFLLFSCCIFKFLYFVQLVSIWAARHAAIAVPWRTSWNFPTFKISKHFETNPTKLEFAIFAGHMPTPAISINRCVTSWTRFGVLFLPFLALFIFFFLFFCSFARYTSFVWSA